MIWSYSPFAYFLSKQWAVVAIAALLSGCTSLPSRGPSAIDIALLKPYEVDAAREFTVLPLDTNVVRILGYAPVASISSAFKGHINGRSATRLGIGDLLEINIWEPSPDGLFSTAERKETHIKAIVGEAGSIFIPYVGQIAVSGLSVEQVRSAIASGLAGLAVDPQVQVALVDNGGHGLSVVGDVARSGRYNVPVSGLRLIEAIALAGGSSQRSFETEVTVVRSDISATVRLDDMVRNTQNNIWLQPGDTLQVTHRPRSFTAFGAVSSQNLQRFQVERVTLAEALAQSGGLNDNLADAGGVFVFRFETESRLRDANVSFPVQGYAQGIPTIYRLDFRDPQAFFIASSFVMQDKDIIYVANAPAAEFQKFISMIIRPLLGSSDSALRLGN